MEDLLKLLMKDAQAAKFSPIRQSCKSALDILGDKVASDKLPAYLLRERCLEPLQLAIESKTKRLMSHAVSGIEKLLKDDRFQSSIETEFEERWLPIQVLNTVYATPNLPEDIQVDVMKLLLKMTFSTSWCMNSRIITQVAQVYIETYCSHAHSNNLKGVVQAALTQLLGSFADKLRLAIQPVEHVKDDVLSDFNAKGDAKVESLTEDVVMLLKFLTDKVTAAHKAGHNKQATPLLLEGIFSILANSPIQLRTNYGFQQLVWQDLCPTLISLLGLPKADIKQKPGSDHGVSMECPGLAPNTAKVIYSISVTLVKMVGPVPSLRPVLESLFHRILMCTAPQHRHDAIKAVKELLVNPATLCDLTVTYGNDTDTSRKPTSPSNDLALIKLIVDSMQECCHSNDSGICYTSVTCIGDLLTAIEQLDRGVGINADSVKVITEKYKGLKGKPRRTLSNRSMSTTSQSDVEDQNKDIPNGDSSTSITPEPEPSVIDSRKVGRDTTVEPLAESEVVGLANYQELERQNAKLFVEELLSVLPQLLSLFTVTEVDEQLQKFASTFSDNVCTKESGGSEAKSMYLGAVLNADSIYSTSYAALCLSLKLALHGFYTTRDKSCIAVSERQFIDSVLDTDMFLYLSPDWLAQVYKCILERDLLTEAGWSSEEDITLITCLKDMDGQGSPAVGSQMMRDSVFLEETSQLADSDVVEAGKLLSHQILCYCLHGILDVLSVMLNSKSVCGVTNSFALMLGIEGAKEDVLRKRDALCKCLDGLQKVAKLCCSLGLQERCAAVFSLLANTSCVMEDFKRATQPPMDKTAQKSSIIPQPRPKLVQLHAAHVLSMDSMMTTGLEISSHSSDCWKHVFRCCAFISELEHTYFSSGNNQSSLPRIQQEQTQDAATMLGDSDADFYGVPVAPVVPVAPRINVANLIKQSSIESGWDRSMAGGSGVLNHSQASQALCGLSQEVDKLFEEASNNLNMTALTSFLGSLCEASKHQLAKISRRLVEEEDNSAQGAGPGKGDYHLLPVNSLHLYRLQNVLMRVAHSDRPLIHLIKAWSVVSSYLVESAGHRDRSISKMAVSIVHDYIVAVMSSHMELKHFHTNEMLCKTFENILCLELCDGDVQDQIVCSICELVEASATDIKSGWRPLFGALRAVRIEYTTVEEVNEVRQRHVEAVLDVFDVYLSTDNIIVFANATVDCILCLLKYVRGPGEFEDSDTDDSDSMSDYMTGSPGSENLCLPALQYLKQCSVILQSMWNMPACPVFHGAKRIQVNTAHRSVDPNIPNMDFKKFSKYFLPVDEDLESSNTSVPSNLSPRLGLLSAEDRKEGDSSSLLSNDSGILVSNSKDAADPDSGVKIDLASLDALDNHTGILHVWFLLLEGLSGAISACPRSYQPQTMETLFELLRSASHVPGTKFAVYCMNHLLLPMLQTWLRSGSRKYGYWDTGATNFKQCCGHTTDLVVDLIHDFKGNKVMSVLLESVLVKLLQVLAECVAQPYEVISRLGCSCIRHILLSANADFTEEMWQIIIDGLQNALDVTTYNVRQLMLVFKAHSENFYGDVGQVKVATRKDCSMQEFYRMWHLAQQVKVATRKDCSVQEFYRMWHLAQQVFLLDSQVSVEPPATNDEDKSYVLLLYPPGYENSLNPDHILARIPFRSIVVGLLSHQLLLQTVGCILLEGNAKPDSPMPGMLSQLSTCHVTQLLTCLRDSYHLACEFDLRPGLKFLLQKVAHTGVAVNLYKQAGASMVFYIHTLIKICSNIPGLDMAAVRTLLQKQAKPDASSPNISQQTQVKTDSPVPAVGQNSPKEEINGEAKEEINGPKADSLVLNMSQQKQAKPDESLPKMSQINPTEEINGEIKSSTNKENEQNCPKEEINGETSDSLKENELGQDENTEVKGQGDVGGQSSEDDRNCQIDATGATGQVDKSSKAVSSTESVGTETESIKNDLGLKDEKLDVLKGKDKPSSPNIVDNASLFVSQLQVMCDELCQNYIDILYDKAGTSCVDSMGQQQLFFLIAQPDEFPLDAGQHTKLDVEKLNSQLQQTQARLQGQVAMTTMSIQEEQEMVPPSPSRVEELPPLSPDHSQPKSKRELRQESESRVYNLATDKLIKNLMTEYKKRKNQNVMPTFAKKTDKQEGKKEKEKKARRKSSASSDPVEQVIEQQQQTSIMKDSEAHLQSWTELLCTILGLLHQLDDARFTTLLPSVFSCVNHLVCHAQDMRLREELAQWLHRVGVLFTLCVNQDL